MSMHRSQSRETALIVDHITSFVLREEREVPGEVSIIPSATDGMSSRDVGSSVDWHTNVQDWHPDFQEAVATIKKGYKLLMQNHGLEMWKYSEDLVNMIDEEQFLKLAVAVTVDDFSGMNWGRIVALFTMSGLLTVQLVKRERQDVVRSLQKWLTAFLSKHLSGWIKDHGGWVSQRIPHKVGIRDGIALPPAGAHQAEDAPWSGSVWQWFLSKLRISGISDDDRRQKLHKDLAKLKTRQRLLERALAEKQKEVVREQQEKTGLQQQVGDLKSQLKDTSSQMSEIMDGIQKLQMGQVCLREGQEEIIVGQENHQMQQRLQSLQHRDMAEGVQELQDHQREIQDGLEELVLAQQSSDVQQRLSKIKQQEAISSQVRDVQEAVDCCTDLVEKAKEETRRQVHGESLDIQEAIEHSSTQLKIEIRSIGEIVQPPALSSPLTLTPIDDDVRHFYD